MRHALAATLMILAAMPTMAQPATPPPTVDENGFLIPAKKPTPATGSNSSKTVTMRTKGADYGPKLTPLVTQLRSVNPYTRLKGAKAIGQLGADGAPAARPICDACQDTVQEVAHAAINALEQIRPDLHAPVMLLTVDSQRGSKVAAASQIAQLGEEGKPALGLLLRQLDVIGQTTHDISITQKEMAIGQWSGPPVTYNAIMTIAADSPEVYSHFEKWAKAGNVAGLVWLVERAGDDDIKQKKVAPFILSGLSVPICQNYCIQTAGEYGALCKSAIPALNQLRLSPDVRVRDAATLAVEKIKESASSKR